MTVETDIKTLLAEVCPRVFPDFAPARTTRPFITFQQVGGDAVNYTGGDVPDLQNGEFQINVWGDTRASVMALMLAIDVRFRGATAFTARPMSAPIADFDADIPVYGARQDWSVWSTR